MCLWASDDVSLTGAGELIKRRKLNDAVYKAISAHIVYVQPLWFTTHTTLLDSAPRRLPVSGVDSWVAEAFRNL